jgi:superfamily II DNA/RNA helicase
MTRATKTSSIIALLLNDFGQEQFQNSRGFMLNLASIKKPINVNFSELDLHPNVLEGVESMNFKTATPVQEIAIPLVLAGRDILASAQTGTGKTAAFLLPILSKIEADPQPGIQCLIIVPTRELALQIDQNLQGLAYFTGVSSMAIYGGGDGPNFDQEKQAIQSGVDVLIATPGRLNSHLNLGYTKTNTIRFFVLDEADRMLDMGFIADITKVKGLLPANVQTLMFSATMPSKIRELAKEIQRNPEQINIAISKPAENILQLAYNVFNDQKVQMVEHILKDKNMRSVIVFCSTKKSVSTVERALQKLKLSCASISSDLDQHEREKVMLDFRNKKITTLVATDLVSRGIDIADIDLVINYDIPGDAEDYVHRIGRTARAATDGVAITLISPEEQGKFKRIEDLIGTTVHKGKLPAGFKDGPEYNPGANRPGKFNNRKKFGNKSGNKSGKRFDKKPNKDHKPQQ